jgi:hypothetical protein
MKIANPIYDVVFKYLMDDNKIAKLIISKIIGEDIESIDFLPKENIVKIEVPLENNTKAKASFTVYRLDFSAKIKTPTGEYKQVIIEIQKAKLPTDIMRFRRYLGQQYFSDKNSETYEENNKKKTKAYPIISIYFLGHSLNYCDSPIINVNRKYIDAATKEEILDKEEFIESITHDSHIIQIPKLSGKRRTELEKLLSIFDQSQKESDHILNVSEVDYPEEYRQIIRKLQKAVVNEEIQNTMNVEDEIIEELGNREREIENLKEALSEKDSMLSEKDNILMEKEKAMVDQQKEIERLKKLLGGEN